MRVTPELQDYLKQWRKARGSGGKPASYSSIAAACNNRISLYTLSRIEQGAVSFLLPHTITVLAEMFGFTESDFVSRFNSEENLLVKEPPAKYNATNANAAKLWRWLTGRKNATNVIRALGYPGPLPGDPE